VAHRLQVLQMAILPILVVLARAAVEAAMLRTQATNQALPETSESSSSNGKTYMSEERTTKREIAQDETNLKIMQTLGRLEGQMIGVNENIDRTLKKIENHEARISQNEDALDNIKIKIGLIGAIIGAAVSTLGNWIWSKITGH